MWNLRKKKKSWTRIESRKMAARGCRSIVFKFAERVEDLDVRTRKKGGGVTYLRWQCVNWPDRGSFHNYIVYFKCLIILFVSYTQSWKYNICDVLNAFIERIFWRFTLFLHFISPRRPFFSPASCIYTCIYVYMCVFFHQLAF